MAKKKIVIKREKVKPFKKKRKLSEEAREKIALFTNVEKQSVISMQDVDSIYKIPIQLNKQNVDDIVLKKLQLSCKKPDLKDWEKVVKAHTTPKSEVAIAMVGKYMDLKDAYKSLNEALVHGGIQHELKIYALMKQALEEHGTPNEFKLLRDKYSYFDDMLKQLLSDKRKSQYEPVDLVDAQRIAFKLLWVKEFEKIV